MDEENRGNLDSFVDIVANTAGIMIVLVIMSLMNSDKAGSKHNVRKVELRELVAAVGEIREEMAEIGDQVELERARDTHLKRRRDGLSRLKLSIGDLPRLPAILEKTQAAGATERVALAKMRSDAERAKQRLDAATVEVGRLVSKEDMGLLKDKDAGVMQSALVNIRALTEDMKKETVALGGRRAQLEGEVASVEKEIAVLEAFELGEDGQALRVTRPPAGPEHDRQRIWFECFTPRRPDDAADPTGPRPPDDVVDPTGPRPPDDVVDPTGPRPPDDVVDPTRPRVRLVSPATYVQEGEDRDRVLRPQDAGETTFDIQEENSAFQQFLVNQPKVTAGEGTEGEKKRYLMFVVRPDAYRVFRLARKLAREKGWEVDWRPIQAAVPRETAGAAPRAPRHAASLPDGAASIPR